MDEEDGREETMAFAPPAADSPKKALLQVLSGMKLGEMFELPLSQELVIGRSEQAQLRFDEDGVSRKHAILVATDRAVHLMDCGSSNGTFIDGARITSSPVRDGALIHVGSVALKLIFASEFEADTQKRMAQAAMRDALTGLYNRRHFEERIRAEVSAARRHRRPLSMLVIDVDHFKKVNDTYGHAAGDEVLKAVALVVQGAIRNEDVAARFGGEEIVVIAREAQLEGARVLAERIRKRLEDSRVKYMDKVINVTASIGVSLWLEKGPSGGPMNEQELFEAADKALYAAKHGGRNRIVFAPGGGA